MLSELVYLLFFTSLSPHYDTIIGVLPEEFVIEELSHLSLATGTPPIKKTDSAGPIIDAASVFAIDLETATPLFTKNIFSKRSIASITKLLTAIIIIDENSLDDVVTVSQNASEQEGSKMWLRAGEKITIRSLLTGMLIASANDAAVALAEYNASSEEIFAKKMNAKAKQLGLRQSHFTNAKGFDENAHFSSAFDTMLLGRAAAKYPFIREIVQKKSTHVTSYDTKTTYPLESTNALLDDSYYTILGLKTGTTPLAGESVLSLVRLASGREILIVILGSTDRFKETKIVIEWIERNWNS